MKTRMLLLVSSLLLAVSASAGSKVSEKRNLSGFEAIEISGSPKVVYTQGKSFSVRVEGERESVDDIETTVSGKTLQVRNKGKYGIFNITFGDSRHAVVYVKSCAGLAVGTPNADEQSVTISHFKISLFHFH